MNNPIPTLFNFSLEYMTAAPDPVEKFRLPAAASWEEGVEMFRRAISGGIAVDRVYLVDDDSNSLIATAFPNGEYDVEIVFPQPQLA